MFAPKMNDRGQIVFQAEFTDGTQGIFISNAVAVPEPATWAVGAAAWLGGAGMTRSRRRNTDGDGA